MARHKKHRNLLCFFFCSQPNKVKCHRPWNNPWKPGKTFKMAQKLNSLNTNEHVNKLFVFLYLFNGIQQSVVRRFFALAFLFCFFFSCFFCQTMSRKGPNLIFLIVIEREKNNSLRFNQCILDRCCRNNGTTQNAIWPSIFFFHYTYISIIFFFHSFECTTYPHIYCFRSRLVPSIRSASHQLGAESAYNAYRQPPFRCRSICVVDAQHQKKKNDFAWKKQKSFLYHYYLGRLAHWKLIIWKYLFLFVLDHLFIFAFNKFHCTRMASRAFHSLLWLSHTKYPTKISGVILRDSGTSMSPWTVSSHSAAKILSTYFSMCIGNPLAIRFAMVFVRSMGDSFADCATSNIVLAVRVENIKKYLFHFSNFDSIRGDEKNPNGNRKKWKKFERMRENRYQLRIQRIRCALCIPRIVGFVVVFFSHSDCLHFSVFCFLYIFIAH